MYARERVPRQYLFLSLLMVIVSNAFANPKLKLNRDVLNFGAGLVNYVTRSQQFLIDNSGDGVLNV